MDIREIFAINLRSFRKAAGLSQDELAHRADVDRTYVSSLERRVYAAGIDVVDKLAGRGMKTMLSARQLRCRNVSNND
jgi:transcriptional regulator with XRE-family HTH domain